MNIRKKLRYLYEINKNDVNKVIIKNLLFSKKIKHYSKIEELATNGFTTKTTINPFF